MQRKYSIITTSMGRLEHLKQSLSAMVRQDAEVVLVDYSCPESSGDYAAKHFPGVRVVRVKGETEFSHAKSHNAGAAEATGEMLIFCDADTIIADGAVASIDERLPPKTYGVIPAEGAGRFADHLPLSRNQLCGFQVIPADAFRAVHGFDEVLRGYADGADTEIAHRLELIGVRAFPLDVDIIREVIAHGDLERLEHYADPIAKSYGAGLIYRAAKRSLMRLQGRADLPFELREKLYNAAAEAVRPLGTSRSQVSISFPAETIRVGMPLQLGYRRAVHQICLTVQISALDPVDKTQV